MARLSERLYDPHSAHLPFQCSVQLQQQVFPTTVRDSTFKSARNTGVNLNQPKLILLECPYPVIPSQHMIPLLLNQNQHFWVPDSPTQFIPSKASDVVFRRHRNSAEQNSQTTSDLPIPQHPNFFPCTEANSTSGSSSI
jgi:hypothetical protein